MLSANRQIDDDDFDEWFSRFVEEKELTDKVFEINTDKGWNYIPIGVVQEYISQYDPIVKKAFRDKLVLIDFHDGNICHFLEYIASYIAGENE